MSENRYKKADQRTRRPRGGETRGDLDEEWDWEKEVLGSGATAPTDEVFPHPDGLAGMISAGSDWFGVARVRLLKPRLPSEDARELWRWFPASTSDPDGAGDVWIAGFTRLHHDRRTGDHVVDVVVAARGPVTRLRVPNHEGLRPRYPWFLVKSLTTEEKGEEEE